MSEMPKRKEGEEWPEVWLGKLSPGQIPENEDPFREVDDETFHIGDDCDERPARVVECRVCGGRDFIVGRAAYFTAIKCKDM